MGSTLESAVLGSVETGAVQFMIGPIVTSFKRGDPSFLYEGAVASSNPGGLWCQKLKEVGVRAPDAVTPEPRSRPRLVNRRLNT